MFKFVWKDDQRKAPKKLNLEEIEIGYQIYKGWQHTPMDINKFKLIPNATYTIERTGGDAAASAIKVWTNSLGRVYKSE